MYDDIQQYNEVHYCIHHMQLQIKIYEHDRFDGFLWISQLCLNNFAAYYMFQVSTKTNESTATISSKHGAQTHINFNFA